MNCRLHAAHGPHVSYAYTKHSLSPLRSKDTQILQKSRSHLRIIDTGKVTRSKLRTEEPQILGAAVQNLVTPVTRHPGFQHHSSKVFIVMQK